MGDVKLRQVWNWVCPACDYDNYEPNHIAEISPEEVAELRWEHDVDPLEGGEFTTVPKVVTCTGCAKMFDAEIEE